MWRSLIDAGLSLSEPSQLYVDLVSFAKLAGEEGFEPSIS